jgi:hypothetical protein
VNNEGKISGIAITTTPGASVVDILANYFAVTDPNTLQRQLYWDGNTGRLVVNGEVNAIAGIFQNVTIAQNCNVLGTIYAANIVGNLFNSQSDGVTINTIFGWSGSAGDHTMWGINGDDFDRILDTNLTLVLNCPSRQQFTVLIRTDGQADQQIAYFDSGNDGGVLNFPLTGITIPTAGRAGHNYIIVRLNDNAGSIVKLTTSASEPANIQIYKKGGVIAYSIDV